MKIRNMFDLMELFLMNALSAHSWTIIDKVTDWHHQTYSTNEDCFCIDNLTALLALWGWVIRYECYWWRLHSEWGVGWGGGLWGNQQSTSLFPGWRSWARSVWHIHKVQRVWQRWPTFWSTLSDKRCATARSGPGGIKRPTMTGPSSPLLPPQRGGRGRRAQRQQDGGRERESGRKREKEEGRGGGGN